MAIKRETFAEAALRPVIERRARHRHIARCAVLVITFAAAMALVIMRPIKPKPPSHLDDSIIWVPVSLDLDDRREDWALLTMFNDKAKTGEVEVEILNAKGELLRETDASGKPVLVVDRNGNVTGSAHLDRRSKLFWKLLAKNLPADMDNWHKLRHQHD